MLSTTTAATARLTLTPVTHEDAPDVLRIYGDPLTWQHLPSGRMTSLDAAVEQVDASIRSRRDHGLGMWGLRVRDSGADDALTAGTFIGMGGVRFVEEAGVWNLGYRLGPAAWGRGFATEISRFTRDFVTGASGPTSLTRAPLTARVLTNNPASVAVIEKTGLTLVWEGRRADVPDPEAPLRRIYADRELTPESFDWLVAHA